MVTQGIQPLTILTHKVSTLTNIADIGYEIECPDVRSSLRLKLLLISKSTTESVATRKTGPLNKSQFYKYKFQSSCHQSLRNSNTKIFITLKITANFEE